jgi:TRAP transporter T-component
MTVSSQGVLGGWLRRMGRCSRFVLWSLIPGLLSGCSLHQIVIDKAGDALATSGTVFAADDDPELIRAAAPFSLKLMESLLAESPNHRSLLSATARGFTQYSYAFVQLDAEELDDRDLAAANAMRVRARRLYARARDYGLRGLEIDHSGFTGKLRADPRAAVGLTGKSNVPLLYWTAASWAALISLSKDTPELIADLPAVEALIDRALELDESFDHGAIHSFLIAYEMVRQGAKGDPESRARTHFTRAVELSGGFQAAPYVALAESVAVAKQDRREFELRLRQAIAIDPEKRPEWRLANAVMQRRAKRLLTHADQMFVE